MERAHSELSTLDQSISQLQQHIEEMVAAAHRLRELRKQKLKKIEYYRSWLCTARLLPVDILVSIFKVQRGLVLDNNDSGAVTSAAVSRQVSLWFGRSSSTIPLSITISMSNTLNAAVSHDVLRAMAMPRFTSRLITISLYMSDRNAAAFRPFLSHPGGLFTALETLVLVDETRWEPKDRPNPDIAAGVPRISVFNNSPNLHSLTLRTNQPLLGPKAPLFPWAQLNSLEVQSPTSVQEFIVSLAWCHHWRLRKAIYHSVALEDPREIEGYPLPNTTVWFGALVELQVTISGIDRSLHDIADAIALLRVPSVQTLALRTLTWLGVKFPIQGVLPSPAGAFPPIRKLSLHHPVIDRIGDVVRIFAGCPQLEALCLRFSESDTDREALLGALLPDANVQLLLPHLTTFIFVFDGHGTLEGDEANDIANAFGFFVASRTRTSINSRPASSRPSPLSRASLYINDLSISDNHWPEIDKTNAYDELRKTVMQHGDLKRASDSELKLGVDIVRFSCSDWDDVV
ncbi:hypothetical protein H0H92_005663 [Tricholoma furcatifolium]|nr:hypothetical protein H0H92_005663 [Tricholoma furcatifolium]